MRLLFVFLSVFLLSLPVYAQEAETKLNETIEIIVTTNSIIIEPDFNGSQLYIAGAIENIDTLARVQNQYNVVIVLEGPLQTVTIRKKRRHLGMWINDASMTFDRVPQYYALATTRELRDITPAKTSERMHLGINNIYMPTKSDDAQEKQYFQNALSNEKKQQNLYSENIGAVSFGKSSLFTAHFFLPANVPVGQYTIKAYLFKGGKFQADATTELEVIKDHLAYFIYNEAQTHGVLYGIFAVLIAIMTGFAGRFIFRKD